MMDNARGIRRAKLSIKSDNEGVTGVSVPPGNTSLGRGTTLVLLAAAALFAGCSGGGGTDGLVGSDPTLPPIDGSPAPGQSPASYKVSGAMSIAQNSVIDADTNDPNQVDRTSNNDFAFAQTIANPTLAVGYLNVPGEGPSGPSRAAGDVVDVYGTSLKAGQVIEVQFSADPNTIDVDLYVFNANRQLVGYSVGRNSYECVRIGADGQYSVVPTLYTAGGASSGGTVYQMRIAAPGSSSSCLNATGATATDIVPGQVIAQRLNAQQRADRRLSKSLSTLPAPVAIKGDINQDRSALLEVPLDMGGMMVSQGLTKSAEPDQAVVRPDGNMPAQSLRKLETIVYAKLLQDSGEYAHAYPNFTVHASQVQAFPPNDREYVKQRWHYDAIDLSGAINLLAGQATPSDYVPIVAVVDTGIVADHPDLRNQLVTGYDFVRDPSAGGDGGGIDSNPDDASDSSGSVFHGTHVAGTVAAQTHNEVGGAGVAPMAKIMPIRVLGKTGSGSFYDILQGVRFAAGLSNDSNTTPARKADVINLSLGGAGSCQAEIQTEFRAVRDAGVITVAASGNESRDSSLTAVGIPANCDDVIAIGATNPSGGRSYFSNGGSNLHAVAPGGDTRRSTTGTGLADGIFSTVASISGGVRTPTYTVMQGTSMASPHAAGIFALMRHAAPNITPDQVFSAISSSAIVDDLGSTGRDNFFGYGQLNARKAVEYALDLTGAPPPAGGQISPSPTAINLSNFDVAVEFELRALGQSDERVVSVTASNNNISVAPKAGAVDATTGLGTYVVRGNRAAGDASGTAFADIVVSLTPARSFSIPVSLSDETVGGSTISSRSCKPSLSSPSMGFTPIR